jgi:hypothetical protein
LLLLSSWSICPAVIAPCSVISASTKSIISELALAHAPYWWPFSRRSAIRQPNNGRCSIGMMDAWWAHVSMYGLPRPKIRSSSSALSYGPRRASSGR